MYRKQRSGWLKHIDFMILDLVCLQLSFIVSYMIRHGFKNPYYYPIYRNIGVFLVLTDIVVALFGNAYSGILRRGYYIEALAVFKQVTLTIGISMMYMFWTQQSSEYSRITFGVMWVLNGILTWLSRCIWKQYIHRRNGQIGNGRSLILVCGRNNATEFIQGFVSNNFENIAITGIVLWDNSGRTEIEGIPVVANDNDAIEYLRTNWVDEIMVDKDAIINDENSLNDFLAKVMEMGITVHVKLAAATDISDNKTVENIAGYTVLTSSVAMAGTKQLLAKRILDIIGGFVGCILMIIALIIVGPVIKIKSHGPVFFKQRRVGKNGKQFTLYKFRSMYVDAEKRKDELINRNEVDTSQMFKIKEDPRIIKGIGPFIRKYSIDELPQFYNVLIGDMSLVGTRPPTVDEWDKYELHHRKRLAIKPGMTGMWQVSGRSSIKDFEEVVALDTKYIMNWSIGLDLKILAKTIAVVFKGDGAM
ncbi:exopolysaccharide biosynthesis polyprenyl glycosylphosphotransferase [Lachnospiraceae bacterium G11]|nr:exopolysaccharide biosynthesis polyprenyl glycosylphosphotransferase [Lachnospiraceae bacterium G11]